MFDFEGVEKELINYVDKAEITLAVRVLESLYNSMEETKTYLLPKIS